MMAEVEDADQPLEEVAQAEEIRLQGIRAVAQSGERFDLMAAMGGVRGIIESTTPGLVFVVTYVITRELSLPLILSLAVTVGIVAARLVQRTDVTQAFSGALGVGIGVLWAWRTGEASNFFAYGLVLNAVWTVALLVTVLVRHPGFGYLIALLRSEDLKDWRFEPRKLKAAYLVTWLWIATFSLRLLIQVPLYYNDSVGWLGTAKLIMGVPLTAIMAWVSWMVVRASVRDFPVDTNQEVLTESHDAA